jgi:hypothetical protein
MANVRYALHEALTKQIKTRLKGLEKMRGEIMRFSGLAKEEKMKVARGAGSVERLEEYEMKLFEVEGKEFRSKEALRKQVKQAMKITDKEGVYQPLEEVLIEVDRLFEEEGMWLNMIMKGKSKEEKAREFAKLVNQGVIIAEKEPSINSGRSLRSSGSIASRNSTKASSMSNLFTSSSSGYSDRSNNTRNSANSGGSSRDFFTRVIARALQDDSYRKRFKLPLNGSKNPSQNEINTHVKQARVAVAAYMKMYKMENTKTPRVLAEYLHRPIKIDNTVHNPTSNAFRNKKHLVL